MIAKEFFDSPSGSGDCEAVSYHVHGWKSGAPRRLADGINRERPACSCDQVRFILLARTADKLCLLGKLGNRAPPPASTGGRRRRQWRDGRVRQ